MNVELTDEEATALLRELDGLIDGDRYFMSQRIKTLRAIRAKIRSEPVREPLPPPPSRMRHRGRRRGRDAGRGANAENRSSGSGVARYHSALRPPDDGACQKTRRR